MSLVAIERPSELRTALRLWKTKFSEGAEVIGNARYWHPDLGIAGHFPMESDERKWWVTFADSCIRFDDNRVVEINPPYKGVIDKRIQGALAKDKNGDRWIMHQGNLRMSRQVGGGGKRRSAPLTFDEFNVVAKLKRVPVEFSNGKVIEYVRVANLDAPSDELQRTIADYVHLCRRVRIFYEDGEEFARLNAEIELIEGIDRPEVRGKKRLAPHKGKEIDRHHADVYHALRTAVKAQGVPAKSARIRGYGYDLLAHGGSPCLFEIKTTVSSSAVQQALGQLLIYESLIEKVLELSVAKVLVVPDERQVASALTPILAKYGIEMLTYRKKGRKIEIDGKGLAKFLFPTGKLKAV